MNYRFKTSNFPKMCKRFFSNITDILHACQVYFDVGVDETSKNCYFWPTPLDRKWDPYFFFQL